MSQNRNRKIIWSISKAKFHFENIDEFRKWKRHKKVFFQFSPSSSDDRGQGLFVDPLTSSDDFEISGENGEIRIALEDSGPVVSARVTVEVALRPGVDDEAMASWSSEKGGWFGSTIYLGPYDAWITEDQGGDWQLVG